MNIFGIIIGLLLLSLLMVVHELGHFCAGKALGFKIISFNIFMGPVLFKHRGKDGVLYCLRLFPVGASVEFAGEDSGINEEPEAEKQDRPQIRPDDPGLFFNRPRWARAIVIAMGPLINFVSAFLALAVLFSALGVTFPRIAEVEVGSPAAAAGFQPGDRILRINGKRIATSLDFSFSQNFDSVDVDRYLLRRGPTTLELSLPREYQDRYRLGISYTPRADGRMLVSAVDPKSNQGHPVLKIGDELLSVNGVSVRDPEAFSAQIGQPGDIVTLQLIRDGSETSVEMKPTLFHDRKAAGYYLDGSRNLGEALSQAAAYPLSIVRATIQGLGMMFRGALSPKEGLTGPVGIVSMIGGVVNEKIKLADKIQELVMLFAFISVAVGFTNLLPIPPFDGFQLLILAIEGVRRKDLSLKLKERLAQLGFFIVILLAILVFYLDLSRLFGR